MSQLFEKKNIFRKEIAVDNREHPQDNRAMEEVKCRGKEEYKLLNKMYSNVAAGDRETYLIQIYDEIQIQCDLNETSTIYKKI